MQINLGREERIRKDSLFEAASVRVKLGFAKRSEAGVLGPFQGPKKVGDQATTGTR
jgi:hypothetical protein